MNLLGSFLILLPYPCQVHAFCSQAPVRDVGYGIGSCAPCVFSADDYLQQVDVRTRGRGSLPFWAKVRALAWECLIYFKGIADGAQFVSAEASDRDDFTSILTPWLFPSCQVHAFCSQAPVRDVGYGFGSCAPCGFSP